ncbi:GTP 3',8-cyclase MoaA [Thermoleophilia bacterium SCSIO 60948]|nr:GTP 3',8-cyclase MoaA [Thermoleophilia bacterium SCSIO 60948]
MVGVVERSAKTPEEPLVDAHGRAISDLRISVTDRCNFRCQYCMPAEGMDWLERSAILSFEEIERLARVFAGLGVRTVRLTGGEPLARRDFPRLAAMLARIDAIEDLSLTTNGWFLERDAAALADAGINRVNISIDSLERDRFFQITRRDALPKVLRGLDAVAAQPSLSPVKVNAIAMRDYTEAEVLRFCEFARETGHEVRFIEFMPLDGDRNWSADSVLSGAETRAIVESRFALEPIGREPHATARVFRFADGAPGEIGFINPVSEPFCADCNRIRLTADGKLRTCLFSVNETDLRDPLRAGASDAELGELIRDAVWRKELKHRVNEPGFIAPPRTMSAIGG